MTDKQVIENVEKKMNATLLDARHKLAAVRTGRASLSMFDGVMVDYYGTMTPLSQVAKLSVPALRAFHPLRSLHAAGSKALVVHSGCPVGGYRPQRIKQLARPSPL